MNLSNQAKANGAVSLRQTAASKGRIEPLDKSLWKHVGGGDYPPAGPNTRHDPKKPPHPPLKG
ncbi:RaxX family RiPP [Xanthomonas dyei]|uniref:Uncharacterized protein n=1 Tax=Xanthomonas dyei TaxID=743699 RepID=A0A2S7CCF9_9XANT|nr:RaxX family RiPP [Xanthomonas dyei]MCC4631935.1 RaxX family RiPP [Xanthomonas dyei pv. eucalypti]PPU59254.1 hypothetical protein XdyCFBP7245_02210 [Xanthomonas dyei]